MDFTERSTRVYRTKQLYTKEELAARDGRIVELESEVAQAGAAQGLLARST